MMKKKFIHTMKKSVSSIALVLICLLHSQAQNLSWVVRDSLWHYEHLWKDYEWNQFKEVNIIYSDIITNENYWDLEIDSLFESNNKMIIYRFNTLSSYTYTHLLLTFNDKFLIINMRESLDSVLAKIIDFLYSQNNPKIEDAILTEVISLHYNNNRPEGGYQYPYHLYNPLKSSVLKDGCK